MSSISPSLGTPLARTQISPHRRHLQAQIDVVYVLPHAYPLGGAERSVLDLLVSPFLADISQGVVFLQKGQLGPWPAKLELASGKARAAGALLSARPRIIHGCLLRGNAFAAALGSGLPNTTVFTNEQNLGHNLTTLKRQVERLVAAREDVCIANSNAVADAAACRIPARRGHIRVIRPGIPTPERTGSRRNATCVAVGRLEPVKDYETLLRAWALVRERHPQATLTIIGDGSDRTRLKRLLAELALAECVWLEGAGDPLPFLRGSTVYVSTARAEGFSRAMLEAMALGLPIVATAVGGALELPAEAVRLVPVGDPRATAHAISSLLDDKRAAARAGVAAHEEYLRGYTPLHCHSAYRDLYLSWLQ
jgi:glycosyltransferase involved in cell wall biosynthesis